MEFYRPHRKDLKECIKSARIISSMTGKSVLYHWIDSIYCMFRYGCCPNQYLEGAFYKLRSFDRQRTFTKYRCYKLRRLFNDSTFNHICDNKVDFNKYFSQFIGRKWISCKECTLEEILSFIEDNNRIIAKPINMTKGKGVFELDRSKPNKELALSVIGQEILLEEFVVQHPLMCFDNKSVNTLRINTIIDSHGDVHIIKSTLRCGIGASIVDNYAAGGVAYPVNSIYGRVEGPGGNSMRGQELFIHPGTDIFMVGKEIPYWNKVLDLVCDAAKKIPQVRFIGWDVAITQEGPILIEGNTRPSAELIEYQGTQKALYLTMLSYK